MTAATPRGGARALTAGERALAQSVYRDAIDLDRVEIRRRKWWPLQPRDIVMAPVGHIHFHPDSDAYADDFSRQSEGLQGLLVHELCHVWQHQRGLWLPLRRLPFCRYRYRLRPGRRLTAYGIEQQAEIVRHAFLARRRAATDRSATARYDVLLAEAFGTDGACAETGPVRTDRLAPAQGGSTQAAGIGRSSG